MKQRLLIMMAALAMVATNATAQQSAQVKKADYPFELTTDAAQPILYYIFSGRDSNGGAELTYVFANEVPWGGKENKLQIVRQDPRIFPNQLWYFMEAEEGVMIVSAEDDRMITVASTADAPKSIQMQTAEERTNDYYIWTLDLTDGCYAFRTSDGKSYLSHNGNWQTAGPQMGLYNANGSKDEGSRVFFEALAPENYPAGITAPSIKAETEAIYTITGQRISSITAPGIYIIGGKKAIVR